MFKLSIVAVWETKPTLVGEGRPQSELDKGSVLDAEEFSDIKRVSHRFLCLKIYTEWSFKGLSRMM